MVDICDKYRELLLKAKDTNTAIHTLVSKRRNMSSESTEIPIELREFEMAIQSFTKSQYRYADKELMSIASRATSALSVLSATWGCAPSAS